MLRGIVVTCRQGGRRKRALLVPCELADLHSLDLPGQAVEPFSHPQRARDDLIDDVASMGDADGRKSAPRDDESVGACDPEKPHAQLIGARPIVAVEEYD